MELINRYIAEVGRLLPEKSHLDIEREIRSLLEDMLEDRSQKSGREIDEEMVVEVLKEVGHPEKVAAAYQPERYLIGPKTYPAFLTVIKIVLPIIIILSALGFGLDLGRTELPLQDLPAVIAEGIGDMIGSIVSALGMVVLVFAILERTVPEFKGKSIASVLEGEWDPRKLPKPAPSPEKVKVISLSFEIAFTVVALVLLNFYPQIILFGASINGEWVSVPILAEIFFTRYLPWLSLIWGLEIVINAVLISRGRWESVTTWLYIGGKAAMIVLAGTMLVGPSLVALSAADLTASGRMVLETAELVVNILQQVVRWTLIIVILTSLVDIISTAWKQLFKRSSVSGLVYEKG